MTKGDLIIVGLNASILMQSEGNKLGAIRLLKKIAAAGEALRTESNEIRTLKPKAKEKEITEAVKEFEAEEFKGELPVIPIDWFDHLTNEPIPIVTTVADKKKQTICYPSGLVQFLEEKGVIK